MRLISAKFKNLTGLYMGTGLTDITIDFTKCTHDIVYIVGKNGSGKSTLMSALHPLPDPSNMYLLGKAGEKELIYQSDEGNRYIVLIQYPVYSNGNRAVTKAYFSEVDINGTITELNTNGTVGSFKDILYSKFSLDPNFSSLSFLSTEDRGLVDMKPSDRKKFIANLLESLEVYNDIYKTMNKRSSSFKAIVNSIAAKIDSIGDEQKLLFNKTAAENRIQVLLQQEQSYTKQIASSEATINLIDPDGSIQSNYKRLFDELNMIKSNIGMVEESIDLSKYKSLQDVIDAYNAEEDRENKYRQKIGVLDANKSSLSDQLATIDADIYERNSKYQALVGTFDYKELQSTVVGYRKKIFDYEQTFKKIGVSANALTKDEYIVALNLLEDFRTAVTNIKMYGSNEAISLACKYILSSNSLIDDLNELQDISSNIDDQKIKTTRELDRYSAVLARTTILEKRPDKCKIGSCPFISDALKAKDERPKENIDRLNRILNTLNEQKIQVTAKIERLSMVHRIYNDINIVIRAIMRNANIINKLPNGSNYTNIAIFVERIECGDTFNDIKDMYQYIEYANIFELYKNDKDILSRLEIDLEKAKNTQYMIKDMADSIDKLVKRKKEIDEKIKAIEDQIKQVSAQLSQCTYTKNVLNDTISKYRKLEELKIKQSEIESQLKLVASNIEKISIEVSKINQANTQLQSIRTELLPLDKMKDDINFSLSKLEEYKKEYDQYNEKYTLVETLKLYSSPTKGIQTIFMQLYMDKTLGMSNKILSMMFNGELELSQYVINENEFRIPILNNTTNMIIDDISNCSTSQKCMIAMIMGFVLAFHGSSVYNIVRLDEIDGGLDASNRSVFPELLRRIMDILRISQCFIVSHSSEAIMTDVDVICLNPVSQDSLQGNVIFHL